MTERLMCHNCITHPQGGVLLCRAHAATESRPRTPIVEIEVRGGVAYVVRKDAGVEVILRDFDNDPKDGDPERHAAPSVIQGTRSIHRTEGTA